MSAAANKARASLDSYIDAMKLLGKPITILRPWKKDHAAVVSERRSKKYKLKSDEDKDFTTYRGYPVEPV